eukprot:tig00021441_g21540.t1
MFSLAIAHGAQMEGGRARVFGPLAGLFLRFCLVVLLALGLVAASFAVVVAATRAAQRRNLVSAAATATQYGAAALAALSVELAVAQTPIGAPFWRGGFRQVQALMGRIAQAFLANGTNAILFGGSVLTLPGTIDTGVNGIDSHLYYDVSAAVDATRRFAVALAAQAHEKTDQAIAALSLCFVIAVPLLVCLYAASLAPSIHEDSIEGVRRGGERFPAQVSLGGGLTESTDREREEPFFVVVARDVSALVAEQRALRAAVERADALLRTMVPADIARRLIAGEQRIADLLDDATLAFFDIPARRRPTHFELLSSLCCPTRPLF